MTQTRVEQPVLLVFHSPRSGRCRTADAYLAQTLQRNGNHETFSIRRIDVERHPELAERFRVRELPTIMVVENKRVVARIEAPMRAAPIRRVLEPWLHRAGDD